MKIPLGDIQSKKLILFKGALFFVAGIVAASVLIGENFSLRNAFLLLVSIWCFCRFYYFAFYVIEKYVDADFKFSSLWAFLLWCLKRRT